MGLFVKGVLMGASLQDGRNSTRRCDVVLAPSYAIAKNRNVSRAVEERGGLLGVVAEPFESWVGKLWEQWGDGRVICDSVQRAVIAEALVARREFMALERTPGLAKAISSCARVGFSVPAFDDAVREAHAGGIACYESDDGLRRQFTSEETEFLACVGEYADQLEERGMIEFGQVLGLLASSKTPLYPAAVRVRFLGDAPLTAQQRAFFEKMGNVELVHDVLEMPGRLSRASVPSLRFAFPAGKYAQPQAILQVISDELEKDAGAEVVVACSDPCGLHERLAPALSQRGITYSFQARKPLGDIALGALLLAFWAMDGDGVSWDKAALSTVLHSRLLGLRKDVVWRIDARLRGDRIVGKQEAFAMFLDGDLAIQERDAFLLFERFASDPFDREAAEGVRRHVGLLRNRGVEEGYVLEQYAALDALMRITETLLAAGVVDIDVFKQVAAWARVNVSRANYGQSAGEMPHVRFMSQEQASQLPPGSATALVACDLTSQSYPLGRRPSAVESILERLGAGEPENALAQARRRFSSLLAVPRESLVLERCLNDADGNPLYPSAMWEEFVDAYREGDLMDRSDIDNRLQLPDNLRQNVYETGEEDLFADMRPGLALDALHVEDAGLWNREDVGSLADAVFVRDDAGDERTPRLSASQIELYLDCPYQWFVSSRLGATDIDEGFGPDKIGTLFHEVFRSFYLTFGKKVTLDNLDEARSLMFGDVGSMDGGVFGAIVKRQYSEKPGRRLVPIPGTTEESEIDFLRGRVENWLVFETTFLPGFTPVAFECEIDDESYLGVSVRGSIDRIDVNGRGQAVIIDYKGSLDNRHQALVGKSPHFADDGKVQTVLYSDIVGQVGVVWGGYVDDESGNRVKRYGLGEPPAEAGDAETFDVSEVVGGLYVSYGKGNLVSGAYRAGAVSGAADIPSLAKKTQCGLPAENFDGSYDDYIEFHRNRIAQAIAGIRAGAVGPLPAGKHSCTYCPVVACEERGRYEAD